MSKDLADSQDNYTKFEVLVIKKLTSVEQELVAVSDNIKQLRSSVGIHTDKLTAVETNCQIRKRITAEVCDRLKETEEIVKDVQSYQVEMKSAVARLKKTEDIVDELVDYKNQMKGAYRATALIASIVGTIAGLVSSGVSGIIKAALLHGPAIVR